MINFLTKVGMCLFETTYTRFNLTGFEIIFMSAVVGLTLTCICSKKIRNIFF